MSFKNLHQDLLELFGEDAPTTYHPGAIRLRRTTAPATKRERDAAWKAANPARVQEHRQREFKKRRRKTAWRKNSKRYCAEHPNFQKEWKAANPDKVRAARLREFEVRKAKRAAKKKAAA